MSSVTPMPAVSEPAPIGPPRSLAVIEKISAFLERHGEALNPILVKECRQALKSRQFVLTFSLVLGACWVWSLLGILAIGASAYYSGGRAGVTMFIGYLLILAIAMLVVVPYGAFRSLVDERDDRTFELLAITTLRPRQIVSGKLGSAVVQMLIYMSAVSPCLGFTYLLGGIELPTILLAYGYCFLMSIGFSLLALLGGTLALSRQAQGPLSVLVVIMLVGNVIFSISGAGSLVAQNVAPLPYNSPDFWYSVAGFALFNVSYDVLFFLAATARLTFPSENRSTPLRIAMLGQHVLLSFAMAWFVTRMADLAQAPMVALTGTIAYAALLTGHWSVLGSMMVGELSQLSARAKRSLPQSPLGRALFAWFMPGSATGYMFALANLAATFFAVQIVLGQNDLFKPRFIRGPAMTSGAMAWGPGLSDIARASSISLLLFLYATIYLSLGRLIIGGLRRMRAKPGIGAAFAINFLVLGAACIAPMLFEELSGRAAYQQGFSWLYIPNPFWTISNFQSLDSRQWLSSIEVVLAGLAVALVAVNLPAVAREVAQIRVAPPARVTEDDAALAVKPVHVPANPFDDGDGEPRSHEGSTKEE